LVDRGQQPEDVVAHLPLLFGAQNAEINGSDCLR
jgi:hypothetical protein